MRGSSGAFAGRSESTKVRSKARACFIEPILDDIEKGVKVIDGIEGQT